MLGAPLRVKPRLEAGASIWRHRLTPGLLDFGPAGSIKLCERYSRVRIAIQGLYGERSSFEVCGKKGVPPGDDEQFAPLDAWKGIASGASR